MAASREQLGELLSAYLDGEVTAQEKSEIESALRTDPGARRLLDELRQTAVAVSALPRHSAPPGLAAEIDSKLERAQLLADFKSNPRMRSSRSLGWRTPLKAAAMLAVVVGAGWWYLAQQGASTRREEFAQAPKAGSESDLSLTAKPNLGQTKDVETRLAEGEDPVLLVNHSFEAEPIRLRVVARNAAERDALSMQFQAGLAQANAENLERLAGSKNDQQAKAGAFYLEGKTGVNYADARAKQILVRLPVDQASQIVDQVASNVPAPREQLALQAGAVQVQGAEKSRNMIQLLADKDSPASTVNHLSKETYRVGAATDSGKGTTLADTLADVVGVRTISRKPAEGISSSDRSARLSETAATRERKAENTDAAPTDESGSAVKKAPTSLVERRLQDAKIRGAIATAPSADDSDLLRKESARESATDRFITMVVEFALPEPKPAPPHGASTRPPS